MLRFIFVCMGVVALSLVAIGAQFMMDGVSDQANDVMARNAETETPVQAVASEDVASPESLNAIETTAGDANPNDTFSGGWTNEAPKALEDKPAQAAAPVETAPAMEEQAN